MNAHFDRAFQYVDEAFARADDAFTEADRGFREARSTSTRIHIDPDQQHRVRFVTHGAAERWRLFKVLFKLSFRALFTGKATLKFQATPK
jgi:hypothetical protein